MPAATKTRLTPTQIGQRIARPVATGATVFGGTLVALLLANGNAVPAGTPDSGNAIGVAESDATAGEIVNARRTVGLFDNSAAADEITAADIGSPCFIVDDQTVARTSDSGSRGIAGTVHGVTEDGDVWVEVGAHALTVNITAP